MEPVETPVILFDGVCNLCNATVQFVLRNEKNPYFKFGTLQSYAAQNLLKYYPDEIISDSVILIENKQLFQKSTAALKISKHLKYYWMLYYLIFIPVWLRDPVYSLIAKNRYRWFGKRTTCMVPDEKLRKRFL